MSDTNEQPAAVRKRPQPAAAVPLARDDHHKLANRMIACGIAIVLLWSTSLSISVNVVQRFIATPSYRDIYDTCEYAYDVTAEEKASYQQCTDRQLHQCDLDFEAAYMKEEERVSAAFAHNTQLLDEAQAAQTACTQAVVNTQKALDAWSTTAPIIYSGDCSEAEMTDVNRIVGDVSALRTASYSLAEDFATTTTRRVKHLSDYAIERQTYDWVYLSNKTSSLHMQVAGVVDTVSIPKLTTVNASFAAVREKMRQVTACISAGEGACEFGSDIAAAYQGVVGEMELWSAIAESTVADFKAEAQRFQADVSAIQETMSQFFDLARRTWNVIKSLDDANFFSAAQIKSLDYKVWGPSFFSIADLMVKPFVFPQPLIPTVEIPDVEHIVGPLKSAVQMTNLGIVDASWATALVAQTWYNELQEQVGGISFAPTDYHPPVFQSLSGNDDAGSGTEVEVTQQTAEAEEFKTKTAVTLQAYSELTHSNSSNNGFRSLNMTKTDLGASFSNFYFTFEPMSAPDYDIEIWIIKLGTMSSYLFIFDLLVRAIHTIALIYSYWNKSAIRLPEADIRKKRSTAAAPSFMSAISGAVMSFISSISFCVLVAVAFVVLLGVVIAAAYIPLYDSYVAACVTHTQNDTFLTSNLYSIAYNYASEDGNNDALQGVQDYNVMHTDYCSSYGSNTQTQQRQEELLFSGLLSAQQHAVGNAELLSKCIDVPLMDAAFQGTCCGMEGYNICGIGQSPNGTCPVSTSTGKPYSPISTYLSQPECSNDFSTLEIQDGTFRCGALPTCTLTCEGPNQQLLDTVTKQCGCMLEWGVHAGFFQITIATVVFALLNLARLLVMRGILMLNWRKLAPNVFVYRANCTENGALIKPARQKKETSNADLLRDQLQSKMRGFKCKGICYIFLGIVINVPWVAFLYLTADAVEYQPSE